MWEILRGETLLNTGAKGDFNAETEIINGQRVVNLTGYSQNMSDEDQFLLAVILGHEAYRDGIVTVDNYLETRSATLAHTQMALRMIFGGESIAYDQNIINDMYMLALNDISTFYSYVDSNYNSSADYWKLVKITNELYGFEWDGKLEYDLRVIGRGNGLESLSEEDLEAIWNAGVNFSDGNAFRAAVETFGILNTAISAFEKAFPSKTYVDPNVFAAHRDTFITALEAVGNSGLLVQTAANILDLGTKPQVFANGAGAITGFFGVRAISIDDLINFQFKNHNGWDFGAREDSRLVAAMDGDLSLDYTSSNGLRITISGTDNRRIIYDHSNPSSIRDFVGLYATNGIELNNNQLTGIAQNMIIGTMGNTGRYTTVAHVHFEYWQNDQRRNPIEFFGSTNGFQITDYARLMSGFPGNSTNFQPTLAQAQGIYNYLSTNASTAPDFPNNFNTLAAYSNQQALFGFVSLLNNLAKGNMLRR